MIVSINEETRVVSLSEFKTHKKITATRLAGVLGLDEYTTPFGIWTSINRLSTTDFRDNPYLTAGKMLEPKIIKCLQEQGRGYVTPNVYYGKFVRDAFAADDIFGGIPDLFHVNDGNQIDCVIEIKTFSSFEKWTDGPPLKYKIQAALYAAELKVKSFKIVGLYIGDYDITDCDTLIRMRVNKSRIVSFEFDLEKDFPEIVGYMTQATKWHEDFVAPGISPPWDEVKDYGSVQDIREYAAGFKDELLQQDLERLNFLLNRQDLLMKLTKTDDKEIRLLKQKLKPARAMSLIPAIYGGLRVTLTSKTTDTVNKEKLKEDGLFSTYVKTSASSSLSVELDAPTLDTQVITGIQLNDSGELKLRKIYITNRSISQGIYAIFNAVYDVVETENFNMAYESISDAAGAIVMDVGGIQIFNSCLIWRKDLKSIQSEGEISDFYAELEGSAEDIKPTQEFSEEDI